MGRGQDLATTGHRTHTHKPTWPCSSKRGISGSSWADSLGTLPNGAQTKDDRYPLTPVTSQESRRAEALRLAENLLSEIELSAITPSDIARKASRLARLTDDTEAMRWLRYETTGYPGPLDADATAAAVRSNREVPPQDLPDGKEGPMYQTGSAGQIATVIEAGKARLPACSNPSERNGTIKLIQTQQGYLDAVVGSIHNYVAERYQELRFGAAIEPEGRSRNRGSIRSIAVHYRHLPRPRRCLENRAVDCLGGWSGFYCAVKR